MAEENIELFDWQSEVLRDPATYKVVNASRRSGKSEAAKSLIKTVAALRKDARIAYISRTKPHADGILYDQLRLIEYLGNLVLSHNRGMGIIKTKNVHKDSTSLIRIFGWNNKEIVKIRGGEYDLVIIDEAAFCNDLTAHFNMEIRPLLLTRMKHNPEVYFFSTPYGFNDFYYLSQMHKDHEDWSYHHHTWRDNPIIDPKDIEIIKAQMPEDEYLQEYEGMFRAIQGLIYKMFDHSKHVFKRASSNIYQTAVGVDFGYSEKGITAIVKINILDNRKYEIVKEKYLPGDTDIADVIDEIVSMTPDLVFADPGAPILVNQLKDRGLPVIDVVKGPGSVKAGITLVQGVIQQSRLYVSRKCTTVLSEFGSYIWKDRRGPDDEQKPKKVNNHLMDAIRYVIVMMEGGLKPVESRGIRKHKAKRKKWKGK